MRLLFIPSHNKKAGYLPTQQPVSDVILRYSIWLLFACVVISMLVLAAELRGADQNSINDLIGQADRINNDTRIQHDVDRLVQHGHSLNNRSNNKSMHAQVDTIVDQAQRIQPSDDTQDIIARSHDQINKIKQEDLGDILEPQAHLARADELTKGVVSKPNKSLGRNRPILQKLKTGKNCKTCQNTLTREPNSIVKTRGVELIVLVSRSLGDSLLKDLWHQTHKFGGKLVFRGLIDGSFTKTQQYIYNIGINADIDPNLYVQYRASQVPLIILAKGDRHDRITGNVSIAHALDVFARDGDLNAEAQSLLKGAA